MEWISVEDRLPEFGVPVLCCFHHWNIKVDRQQVLVRVLCDDHDWKVWDTGMYYSELNPDFTVTHWMPLPEPPKGE